MDAAVRYPKMSEARRKMLTDPGWLYAARSRYCDWIKIGFTSKSAKVRLAACNNQYAEFAPFSLIRAIPSTWAAEQQLHYLLAPFRQRHKGRTAELYPAVPALVAGINIIFSNSRWDRMSYDEWRHIIEWSRRAAQHPLNRERALESFELYRAERGAPNASRGGTGTAVPSGQGRAPATIGRAA